MRCLLLSMTSRLRVSTAHKPAESQSTSVMIQQSRKFEDIMATRTAAAPLDEKSSDLQTLTALRSPTSSLIDLNSLELLDQEDLINLVKTMVSGGVFLNFYGKRSAAEIAKRVRPRVTRRVNDLHVGAPEEQACNIIIEGENLQAMTTLYKYRGQIDLILTDPPYNTGNDFRYNDRYEG
jgi:hypothetical protein